MLVNVSSTVVLSGFEQLSPALRLLLFFLLLFLWIAVVFSDSLLLYVITSCPTLQRPMYIFIAAVLANSLAGSCAVYPKLLSDLSAAGRVVVARASCVAQAYFIHTFGSSSFLLLAAMALDRLLSVTWPLRYTALMSPVTITTLLLISWLVPFLVVGVATVLASRLPLCSASIARIYCDTYSFISMSCSGAAASVSVAYGLVFGFLLVFVPVAFVVFSYAKILVMCLFGSRSFNRKVLATCGPHIAVFLNYTISSMFELLHRRVQSPDANKTGRGLLSVAVSLLVLIVPTFFNPVVYGLKVAEIYRQISKLLRRR